MTPNAFHAPMLRLSSMAIVVSDAKKSARWYQDKLGFDIRDREEHWVTVAPKGGDLAFHLCEGFYPLEPGNTGIAFLSKSVEKEEKSLRDKGVKITHATSKEDWGTYAMFADPEGNEFWLIEG